MRFLNKKIDYEKLYQSEFNEKLRFERENNYLKNECLDLKNQIDSLQKEIDFLNEKIQSINQFKIKLLEDELSYFKNEHEELMEELSKQREQLSQFNKNLKPIPKKVNKQKVEQVKKMINENITYREISKKIDISITTISKIVNGYYDNKL